MLISSHDVYECFHTTIAECFQQRLPILHLKYWLSVAWQKHFTHLGLDSQAQIPEEWKETSALLNEMQPLPKHLFFLPKTTNLPIISKTRADTCDWWSAGHMTKGSCKGGWRPEPHTFFHICQDSKQARANAERDSRKQRGKDTAYKSHGQWGQRS